jgi:hypothetical protein
LVFKIKSIKEDKERSAVMNLDGCGGKTLNIVGCEFTTYNSASPKCPQHWR